MSRRSSARRRSSTSQQASLAIACMQALEGRTYFGAQFGRAGIIGGSDVCTVSPYPVTYENGLPEITETDFESTAFGHPFGQVRGWVGVDDASQNGNGWMINNLPYLVVGQSQADGGMVQLIQGSASAENFYIGNNDTAFTYQGKDHLSLAYIAPQTVSGVNVPGMFSLTDADGNVTTFYDLPRDSTGSPTGTHYGRLKTGFGYTQEPTNQFFDSGGTRSETATNKYRFGAFASYTDASGNYTVTAVYDSNGNLTNLRRTDGSGSYEQMVYTYKTISNGTASDTLISSVSLQTGYNLSGLPTSWTTTKTAVYQYYEGGTDTLDADNANGRLGDLKFAATTDPSNEKSVYSLSYDSGTNKVTITTSSAHGYSVGDMVTITGANETEFDGVFRITDVTSSTVFKYAITGSSNSTGSGTIKVNQPINVDYYRYNKFHTYSVIADPGKVTTAHVAPWDAMDTMGSDLGGGTDETFPALDNGGSDADNLVESGLRAVVDGTAFDRLTSEHDGSIESLPDFDTLGADSGSDLQSYANNLFTYQRYSDSETEVVPGGAYAMALYRVVQEVAAGSGCSMCSGGFGTTKLVFDAGASKADPFDANMDGVQPNTWVMKTTEYIPDATNTFITHPLASGHLTSSSITATVSYDGHGFSSGDYVTVTGASDPAFDGTFAITRVDDDTFTYKLPYTPDDDSPTGTITISGTTGWSDNDQNIGVRSTNPTFNPLN